MPNKHSMIVVALVVFVAAACGPLDAEQPDVSGKRSSLTLSSTVKLKLPALQLANTTDRMTWNEWGQGRGAYWRLSDYGAVRSKTQLSHPSGWNLVGVAGDRVLWSNGSGQAELWTIDASNKHVRTHALRSPGQGFVAVGLSLASPIAWNCYERGSEQNYYVTWDAVPNSEYRQGQWAVQLVAGDGYQRRLNFMSKPFSSLTALWFGYAADGYEAMLFRDNTGGAYKYRAQWTGTGYSLHNLTIVRRSGYQVVGMTAKKRPSSLTLYPLGGTPFNDHLLFTSYNQQSGNAILAAFDYTGNHLKDWTFTRANSAASGYSYVPPLCN